MKALSSLSDAEVKAFVPRLKAQQAPTVPASAPRSAPAKPLMESQAGAPATTSNELDLKTGVAMLRRG